MAAGDLDHKIIPTAAGPALEVIQLSCLGAERTIQLYPNH